MPLFLMLMLIPTVIHMKMSSGQNQELTLYFEKQEKWYRTFYLLHKPPIFKHSSSKHSTVAFKIT